MVPPRPSTSDHAPIHLVWAGDITGQGTAPLREALFAALAAAGRTGVELDVRDVRSIDRSGVALLIGANHRAADVGRTLVLIDRNGPVTRALSALRVLHTFEVTQVLTVHEGSARADASPR